MNLNVFLAYRELQDFSLRPSLCARVMPSWILSSWLTPAASSYTLPSPLPHAFLPSFPHNIPVSVYGPSELVISIFPFSLYREISAEDHLAIPFIFIQSLIVKIAQAETVGRYLLVDKKPGWSPAYLIAPSFASKRLCNILANKLGDEMANRPPSCSFATFSFFSAGAQFSCSHLMERLLSIYVT